jgi:hypothetical protein
MALSERLRTAAAEQGPLAAGRFRVSVLEADRRVRHRDFATKEEAVRYANDVASEDADDRPIAYVFDDGFRQVHEGKPYHY